MASIGLDLQSLKWTCHTSAFAFSARALSLIYLSAATITSSCAESCHNFTAFRSDMVRWCVQVAARNLFNNAPLG